MKEFREHITTAALIAVSTVTPAALVSAIIYLVSHNDTISDLVFFCIFTALLFGLYWWSKRQQKPLTVHEFVAYLKMHPGLLPPGTTEFDLERFRLLHSGSSHARLDAWIKQFRTHHEAENLFQEGDLVIYLTEDGQTATARVRRVYPRELELASYERGYERVPPNRILQHRRSA